MKTHFLAVALIPLLWNADPACGQARGVVEGRVALPVAAARKHVSRYPGADAAHGELQEIPPVVWLSGDLPAEGAPGGTPPDTFVINQQDRLFVPGALAVRTGTVVRFPNSDPFYHNVFSYSGPRFDLGRYAPGTARQVTLDRPGLIEVYCEIHGSMRAVVVVTDNGLATVAAADGTFRIAGVPPGSYTLRVYHPDHGTEEVPVTVTGGGTTRVTPVLGG